jgi:hypothetical protein
MYTICSHVAIGVRSNKAGHCQAALSPCAGAQILDGAGMLPCHFRRPERKPLA